MRILMSGMSTRTVGSSRLKIDYLNFNPLLKLALEALGHEVDQRKLTYGEDLSGYDAGFLHVSPLDKLVCQNVPEVCYALSEMGPRAIIFCEDWVSTELRSSWNSRLAHWDAWLRWKGYQDLPPTTLHRMSSVLKRVIGPDCPWPVIANFYGWGDATQFFAKNFDTKRVAIIDPSSMALVPEFKLPGEKQRRWVLATLQKHDAWTDRQGFTWPVVKLGNVREGQPVLQERDVVQLYADSWGVLAPRYEVQGWFRPRFLLAAATGSVLFCDSLEGARLGEAYTKSRDSIERASVTEMASLARDQATLLATKVWSRDRLLSELTALLDHVAQKGGAH